MITVSLPIYMIVGKRNPKNTLIGMNWYRGLAGRKNGFHQANSVKAYYESIVESELKKQKALPIEGRFITSYDVFVKRTDTDPSNIVAVFEKFWLDALQNTGIIQGDDVKFHAGSDGYDASVDKENPRIVCTVTAVLNETGQH